MPEGTAPEGQKTCFVVMGFGEKVDFQTGRKLNLDASYHNMIKPAVEDAGLKCIRADEIVHSGVIDVPMYEQLLNADIVIADLSTYNPNAFYELGVRHALRPFSTIIIAEDKLNYPFDVNHIVIRRYRHLGDDIGVGDARKFSAELKQALAVILAQQKNDSPVYEFLNGLTPPEIRQLAADVAAQAAQTRGAAPPSEASDVTLRVLMQQADKAQRRNDFVTARSLLEDIREMMRPKDPDDQRQEDPYIIQRLALVTYKSEQPNPRAALEEARELLKTLDPNTSNDTETLGLWGAVHKRLWDITEDEQYLDEAVRSYERGFRLRHDYYNGINLAFLHNVYAAAYNRRADAAASAEEATSVRAEAISCFVQAKRIRREVISICDELLAGDELTSEQKYWTMATMAEAYLGAGDEAAAGRKLDEAFALPAAADWMKDSTQQQMDKLRQLLAKSPLNYIKSEV
ncbi:MAG TPA: tetratricopeptide repeat-containing protein [Pyrinomonadaceae bacterium]|nr:tetratricopeptide repeat-containing protein [Pyrinomonadaceae bacterium]